MNETLLTCLTQFFTTGLTLFVSIIIAVLTYRSQKKRTDDDVKRLQSINCNSALELFKAYVSCLIFFVPTIETQLKKEQLTLCCERMKLIEQYLSDLLEAELPDNFIYDFRVCRLKVAFQRLQCEHKLNADDLPTISSAAFAQKEINNLISFIQEFIDKYSGKKTEG